MHARSGREGTILGGVMGKRIKPGAMLLTLFVLGEVVAFGFICLLQFVSAKENLVGFIFTLISMHTGIICFILSKKLFRPKGNTRKHYFVEYVLSACYLSFLSLALTKVSIDHTLNFVPDDRKVLKETVRLGFLLQGLGEGRDRIRIDVPMIFITSYCNSGRRRYVINLHFQPL